MKAKERILNAITGRPIDRVPWCPFLAYWWECRPNACPDEDMGLFMQSLGADPMLRGFGQAWKMTQHGVAEREMLSGDKKQRTVETPVGTLTTTYTYSKPGNTWFLTGHPVKTVKDIQTLMWLYEHRVVAMDAAALDRLLASVGDDGLVVPILGVECKTSFQSLVEHWMGTEALCYLLADEPDAIGQLLAVMRECSRKTVVCSAQSSAEAFIFWEDSSTTNISPSMFLQYTAPEIADWGNLLHKAGKLLIHHACGSLKGLMPMIAALPIDALESISPPPTGDISIAAARGALPEHIAIIGGIEPVFFENCTLAQLRCEVEKLLKSQKGSRYVLANSDSCPPGVSLEKLRAIAGWL